MMRSHRLLARISVVLLIAFIPFSLPSCADLQSLQQSLQSQTAGSAALTCGAGGALAGALAGTALDSHNRSRGALIGALTGGLLGATTCYFFASYQNQEIKDYQATKAVSGYKPSQGDTLKLTDISIKPQMVTAGNKMAVAAKYYLMTPDPNQDIPITETWSVSKQEGVNSRSAPKPIGSFSTEKTIKPGTRQSSGEIPLQSSTEEGDYVITLKVSQGNLSDQRDAKFTVTRNVALADAAGSKALELSGNKP